MRSDAAPRLDQGITPTWTGVHLASAAYRNSAYAHIGSTAAPANTTAGDLTSIRHFLTANSQFTGFRSSSTRAGNIIYEWPTTDPSAGQQLQATAPSGGVSTLSWAAGGSAHNLLSATHTDTAAASPTRGDLVVANSTPVWARVAVGTNGSLLISDGTDPSWQTDIKIAGYLRVGSTSAPSNTTAGDITGVRGHFGTNAAFGTGHTLEVNAARFATTGTYETGAISVLNTLTGDGSYGIYGAPNLAPTAGTPAIQYAFLGIPQINPAGGITLSNAVGFYGRTDFAGTTGAVTTSTPFWVAAPSFVASAIKPTFQRGIYIENQGSASINSAWAIWMDKPTGATNNFYIRFNTGDATDPTGGGGAATGRIAVDVAGTLRYLAYY